MMYYMSYILSTCIGISIAYLLFLLWFRKINIDQQRVFLLGAVVISLMAPLFNLTKPGIVEGNSVEIVDKSLAQQNIEIPTATNTLTKTREKLNIRKFWTKAAPIVIRVYVVVALAFLLKFIVQLTLLLGVYFKSIKDIQNGMVILYNKHFPYCFSFFNLVFIPQKTYAQNDLDKILVHEKVHARKWHSVDLIEMEILVAVMWFNPFIWMMRSSLCKIHEYQADAGVINGGADKLHYQQVLINQTIENGMLTLSSPFSQTRNRKMSTIKNRIFMMNNAEKNKNNKKGIYVFVIAALLLAVIVMAIKPLIPAFQKQDDINIVTAVEPTKMNVLYVGVNNPVKIASSGYKPEDLTVTVTNGLIKGGNGEYIIMPRRPGNVVLKLFYKEKEVGMYDFRVKEIPDPFASIKDYTHGKISKELLLQQDGVNASMPYDFDFDLKFKVVSFTTSTIVNGFSIDIPSSSNLFTAQQKQLFEKLHSGDKLYITDIKAVGPDGIVRPLPLIDYTIE